MLNKQNILESAQRTLDIETYAIKKLDKCLDEKFAAACEILYNCKGHIIVTGMGKSGHVANKIAATLASTGSPAFSLHPADAGHGDLGMINKEDVLLIISKSGNTPEVLSLLPAFKLHQTPIISITSDPKSTIARSADINLNLAIEKEACPLDLAPTASTTATAALGDAIAVALLEARQFTRDDFARFHPSGNLGKRLLLRVEDLMRTGPEIPQVKHTVTLRETLLEMTHKRMGFTAIIDAETNKLMGVFTDGDLRRAFENRADITTKVGEIIRLGCKTIDSEALAIEALELMEKNKITSLLILNTNQEIIGAIHMHDILSAGLSIPAARPIQERTDRT